VLLIVSILLVFWPVTDNGFINFDDPDYITENPMVRSGLTLKGIIQAMSSVQAGNWHPVTWISHMIDVEIFGLAPGGHHLISLLLHLANAIILFSLFNSMTGAPLKSGVVAALFAFHPLHVESVAWAAERKDVLSTFFWMLTLWAYTGFVQRPSVSRYVVMILCFVLGLMAKPMLVTLPFVLLLLDVWPLKRFYIGENGAFTELSNIGRLLGEKLPLFLLSGISCIVTFSVQQQAGAVGPLSVYSLGHRVGNAIVVYIGYILKTLWPVDLAVFYPHPGLRPAWQIASALICLFAVTLLTLRNLKKHPYLFTGWFWYLGTLVPVIGLVQVGAQAMADRYTYIPLIGLFLVAAFGVPALVKKKTPNRILLPICVLTLLAAMIPLTRTQISHWRNDLTLYRHALEVTQGNYLAHNNLGLALEDRKMPVEAKAHYLKAIEIDPVYEDAHINLSNLLEKEGRTVDAVSHLYEVLRFNPNSGQALYNLGVIREKQGKDKEAQQLYRSALDKDSHLVEARNNLGNLLSKKGRFEEAVGHYDKAVSVNPLYESAWYNMGIALEKLGRTVEAEAHYRRVLSLNPRFGRAHTNLGGLLLKGGEIDAALPHYYDAVFLEPDRGDLYFNLAVALEKKGQVDKAIFCYQEAVRLDPGLNRARINLGSLWLRLGKPDSARNLFEEALLRDPKDRIARRNLQILEEKMETVK